MKKPVRILTHKPVMRRRSNWSRLSKAELRLLMAGLAEWERRSSGPVRSRIRRKRIDAVHYYRKTHGFLTEDRLWVQAKMPRTKATAGRLHRKHSPAREHENGVLWHEA